MVVEVAEQWGFGGLTLEPSLDLLEVRRELITLRSRYSHEVNVTIVINKLLAKIAHLREPENIQHEKRLQEIIAKTVHAVEDMSSYRF
ncbi:hypothetical protein JQ621_24385 [Bradyrhizobium manausense]|uniref:hypothetical protein n=1 Tax=Bradyrhizobium manausense TaxID=989370 RepID=UPI001BADA729|nr:hypothetical protein [Bradyrhizobium manausense]MBR1090617.1 hypothetical protein [Bradyrhizobium manausense]